MSGSAWAESERSWQAGDENFVPLSKKGVCEVGEGTAAQ